MSTESNKKTTRRQLWTALLQGAGAGLALSLAFAAGFFIRDFVERRHAAEISFDLLQEADGILQRDFLYELPDDSARVHGAVSGLVASLEEQYTYFVEPQSAEVDADALAGRFGGIGAEIGRNEEGYFFIHNVYRDNPAYEAGLEAGDILLAVDGITIDITAPDLTELLAAVRGEVGEPVVLTIRRGDETFDVEIIRAEVLIPSTFWRILEEDTRIGYVQITRFTDRTPEEIREALGELLSQDATGLILDLRNNGGGLVDSAVDVGGEFLDGGIILLERRRDDAQEAFNASRGGSALDIPLVVLTNHSTASASEILAGAFQDRERAILVGQQTFGKGSVQYIRPLSDGSSIHVTTAEWYTPDQHRIQGEGLTPDVLVTQEDDGQDTILIAAVDVLADQLARSE